MSPRHFALFASFCEISLPSFALWPIGRVSPSPGPRRRRGFMETAHWRSIVAQRRGCSNLCLARRPAPHPDGCAPQNRADGGWAPLAALRGRIISHHQLQRWSYQICAAPPSTKSSVPLT